MQIVVALLALVLAAAPAAVGDAPVRLAQAGSVAPHHPAEGLPSPQVGFYVQLGTAPSYEAAQILFAALREKHAALIGERPAILFRFDAEEDGLLYRLGLGPAGDAQPALTALCEALKAAGTDCRIRNVPPDGRPSGGGEASMWSWAKSQAEPHRYQEYLGRYPRGPHAALARQRLIELAP